jgi:hypothetical protein
VQGRVVKANFRIKKDLEEMKNMKDKGNKEKMETKKGLQMKGVRIKLRGGLLEAKGCFWKNRLGSIRESWEENFQADEEKPNQL